MGGTSSTVVDLVCTTRDRKNKAAAVNNLDGRLEVLRKEVQNRPQAITKGVAGTISTLDDAVILSYSQLQDKRVIVENVEKIFQKFPGREHVVSATCDMMANTEYTSLQGWQHCKKFKHHEGKDIGIEIHLKTEMFEDTCRSITTTLSSRSNTDTIVLIAYKCLVHTMDPKVNHGYLDVDQLSESMISVNIQGLSLEVSSYSYSHSSSSLNVSFKSTKQQVLKTRQMNEDKHTMSCALGTALTANSDSDDSESYVAKSTFQPLNGNSTRKKQDSGIASLTSQPSEGELTSNEESDKGPRNPRSRPSAWLSTTCVHPLLSLHSSHSQFPLSRYFKGVQERPFSFEW